MDENNEKWIQLQEKVKKADSEMGNIIGVNISVAVFTLKSPKKREKKFLIINN